MNRCSSSAKPWMSKLIIRALLCAFAIAAKGTTGQEQEDVSRIEDTNYYSDVTLPANGVSDDINNSEGEKETTTFVPASICKKFPNTRYAKDYAHSPLAELGGRDAALIKCLENPECVGISISDHYTKSDHVWFFKADREVLNNQTGWTSYDCKFSKGEGEDCGPCFCPPTFSAGKCAPGLYCDATIQTTIQSTWEDPERPLVRLSGDSPGTCKPISSIPRLDVHRYWKSRKDHFYTTSLTEIGVSKLGAVGNYGYKYEGVGFRILANQVEGTKALLRYWKPQSTDHFYTTNQNEINVTKVGAVGNHGYKLEGQLGFCFADARDAETVPLYRYFNKVFKDHFYTTNFKELGWGNRSWNYEGIQCYVYPA